MGKTLNIDSYTSKASTIVTIGTFDGVHIGHQKILNRLITTGNAKNLDSIILTFFPHPRMVLQKDANIKLINTINERSLILKRLGLDYLIIQKFTKVFSRLTAKEFVEEVLVKQLKAKKVIIGYDHRFGRNRNADITDLIRFGHEYNFDVEEISPQDIDDVAVSSTKIRNALLEGAIKKANTYLGYPFMLTGNVIKGKGLGRQINYPTANIEIPEQYKLIPKYGAYVVKSNINGKDVFGMMNIGINPTVNGKTQSIEVHFFNFNTTLYNKEIQVDILERIRNEEKFQSIENLKAQLEKDKIFSLDFISKNYAK